MITCIAFEIGTSINSDVKLDDEKNTQQKYIARI